MSVHIGDFREWISADVPKTWLTAIASSTDVAIIGADLAGAVVFWNNAAEAMLGYSGIEIIGRPIDIIVPPERSAEEISHLDRIRHGERIIHHETERLRKDGTVLPILLTLSPIRDRRGTIIGAARIARDLSCVRRMPDHLGLSQATLRSVFDSCPIALVTISEDGVIRDFGAAAVRMFGFLAERVAGRDLGMLMASPDREWHGGSISHYLATERARTTGVGRVVTGQRKDGTTFPMHLTIAEVNQPGERLFTGFMQDLTERQAVAHRLSETEAELIHVSRISELDNMAAMLAHEVAQPLAAIANYADAAESLLVSDDQSGAARAVKRIADQAVRAREIVHSLGTLSRKGTPRQEVEDLTMVIDEVCKLALAGAGSGLTLTVQVAEDAKEAFIDKVRIQQVLLNLIRNALQAMDGLKRRELRISTAGVGNMVEVQVADTGNGLPEHVRKRLFRPFMTTRLDGMGIGLSVCRLIVEGHRGAIRAENGPAGGAVFSFTVPRPGAALE